MHPMHYPQHDSMASNHSMYLTDLLAVPIVHRCAELGLLIDRCSLKELQPFFPQLVHSIFGGAGSGSGAGWGLRTLSGHTNPHEFDVLYSFLSPMGPMFRLCYRLLAADQLKFEVPVEALPPRTAAMLRTGRFAPFYADTVTVDAHRRQITALALNAFDYYVLHFALHGMEPLQQMQHPAMDAAAAGAGAGASGGWERRRTLYVYLAADLMCTFLPSDPEALVQPSNVGGAIKASAMMAPIQQQIQPARSPKYIKLSALTTIPSSPAGGVGAHHPTGSASPLLTPSPGIHHQHHHPLNHSPNSSYQSQQLFANSSDHNHHHHHPHLSPNGAAQRTAWRSESVLHLFIDTWLRIDIDAQLELPSPEFIRTIRIAVKQLHAFANSAPLERNPEMAALRYAAPALLADRMYQLLGALLRRWPMDSSFAVVLELWLSFIQPWRYGFERQQQQELGGAAAAVADDWSMPTVQQRHEPFVRANQRAYTQILVLLLPRLERLNYGSLKTCSMMSRLLKVFAQPRLAALLRHNEAELFGGGGGGTSFAASQTSSPAAQRSPAASFLRSNCSSTMSVDSDSPNSGASHSAANSSGAGAGGNYVCLFGAAVQAQIGSICAQMLDARYVELGRAARLVADERRREALAGRWRRLMRWAFAGDEQQQLLAQLADCSRIAELLETMLEQLAFVFDVQFPPFEEPMAADNASGWSAQQQRSAEAERLLEDEWDGSGGLDGSGNRSFDMSMSFEASAAARADGTRWPSLRTYTVDPAAIPAQSYEVTVLVRFLYQVSAKLNFMYEHQLEQCWHRTDLVGRCCRQLLAAPLRVHHFDKADGVSRVREQRLRPRINLRPLASYQALLLIAGSLAIGQLWCGAPSFGLIGLLLLGGLWVLLRSLWTAVAATDRTDRTAAAAALGSSN